MAVGAILAPHSGAGAGAGILVVAAAATPRALVARSGPPAHRLSRSFAGHWPFPLAHRPERPAAGVPAPSGPAPHRPATRGPGQGPGVDRQASGHPRTHAFPSPGATPRRPRSMRGHGGAVATGQAEDQESTMKTAETLEQATALAADIEAQLNRVLIGQPGVTRQVLIALITGGHVLIEGVPGLGKTLLARSLARVLKRDFQLIQFTPDMMPTDVTGHAIH